jgi:hypothetical protein
MEIINFGSYFTDEYIYTDWDYLILVHNVNILQYRAIYKQSNLITNNEIISCFTLSVNVHFCSPVIMTSHDQR